MKKRYYLRLFGGLFIRVPRRLYNSSWHGLSGMVHFEYSPEERVDIDHKARRSL